MPEQRKNKKSSWTAGCVLLRVAAVLFCLVVVSTYLMSDMFARYTTSASGSDSARVIKFGNLTIEETTSPLFNDETDGKGKLVLAPGVNLEKDVKVSFAGSESSVFIFVQLETNDWNQRENYHFYLEEDGQEIMSWEVDNASWKHLGTAGNQSVYYMLLPYNTVLNDSAVIKNGTISVSKSATYMAYEDLQGKNLSINVTAYAVQAGGFITGNNPDVNAAAAWAAVGH